MPNGNDLPLRNPYIPMDSTARQLADEAGESVLRQKAGSLAQKGATDKLGESIGEFGTRRYVERAFHGRIISETPIPTRGLRGAPMLDVVYELDNGDFVVLESKYNTSKMGKVNRNVIMMGDTGPESTAVKNLKEAKDATIRIDKKAINQFAPEWFQDRVREIRSRNPKLAARLERAWENGKIHAHVIRVNKHGFGTLEADLSEPWRVYKQRAIPVEPPRTPNLGKTTTSGALDVNRPGGNTNVERGLPDDSQKIGNRLGGDIAKKAGKPAAQVVPSKRGGSAAISAFKGRSFAIGIKAWTVTRTITRAIGNLAIHTLLPLMPIGLILEIGLFLLEMWLSQDARWDEKKRKALRAALNNSNMESLIQSEIWDKPEVLDRFMKTWNDDPYFSGFLYARLEAKLDRGYPVWDVLNVKIIPTVDEHKFEMIEIPIDLKKEPQSRYVNRYILGYTFYPPLLTPFDIVISHIKNLFLDTIYFVGELNDFGGELIEGFFGFDYRYDYQNQFLVWLGDFEPPLNKSRCDYCLRILHSAGKDLSQHSQMPKDVTKNALLYQAWVERRRLLDIFQGKYSFLTFADKLDGLVQKNAKTPIIQSAIDELKHGAETIDMDLRRIGRDIRKPEYFYQGPKYKISSRD